MHTSSNDARGLPAPKGKGRGNRKRQFRARGGRRAPSEWRVVVGVGPAKAPGFPRRASPGHPRFDASSSSSSLLLLLFPHLLLPSLLLPSLRLLILFYPGTRASPAPPHLSAPATRSGHGELSEWPAGRPGASRRLRARPGSASHRGQPSNVSRTSSVDSGFLQRELPVLRPGSVRARQRRSRRQEAVRVRTTRKRCVAVRPGPEASMRPYRDPYVGGGEGVSEK